MSIVGAAAVPGAAPGMARPDFLGLAYAYLSTGGDLYHSDALSYSMACFPVRAGRRYFAVLGETAGNRLRLHLYYGAAWADVAQFFRAPSAGGAAPVRHASVNVTGTSEITGDALLRRVPFTPAQDGVAMVMSSNQGAVVPVYLVCESEAGT